MAGRPLSRVNLAAAEQTTSGYYLYWKLSGGDSYGVWDLDSSGNSTLILSPTSCAGIAPRFPPPGQVKSGHSH
jgi:hypothetical protein